MTDPESSASEPRRSLFDLITHPPDLPIVSVLDQVTRAAHPGTFAVVSATAGSGKTTLIAPAVAARVSGTVVCTQPRRMAARASARRIASLLGERVGETVGFTVRGERAVGPHTRIEMVTPGVLVRRLQAHPDLPGVSAVILDEFHERALDSDLALAFLLDVRQTLREDLTIFLTSATLDMAPTLTFVRAHACECEGADVMTIEAPGVLFPLEQSWAPAAPSVSALAPVGGSGRVGVSREFLAHMGRVVDETVQRTSADVLVFVPGAREIRMLIDELRARLRGDVEIVPLLSALSAAEQDRILTPVPEGCERRRRVIVSTSIAESSLTVPGVRVVVDSALARHPSIDPARGVTTLVTVPASRAEMVQRSGRAARLGPGWAVRCCAENEWARRRQTPAPEIVESDLTDALLQCAVWGVRDFADLPLMDQPPSGNVQAAREALVAIGALDTEGAPTPHGEMIARLPVAPSLAHALAACAPVIGVEAACECVAIIDEQIRCDNADLAASVRRLRHSSHAEWSHIRDQSARLTRLMGRYAADMSRHAPADQLSRDDQLALVAATAHPQWIMRRRGDSFLSYQSVSGLGASLPATSPLAGQQWLAVSDMTRPSGSSTALIRAALPLSEDDALGCAGALVHEDTRAWYDPAAQRFRGEQATMLGAIRLASRSLRTLPPQTVQDLMEQVLNEHGMSALTWTPTAVQLRARMAALHETVTDPWPDVSDAALASSFPQWGAEDLPALASGKPLTSIDTMRLLRSLLPWPQAARLDELTPPDIEIPTGARRRIEWTENGPTLTLRVQEAFGWTSTPRFVDGRVPLIIHLTDPAGRPVAITSDLASFWAGPYQQVRSELRGRYTKHAWPEDPLSATPSSRAKGRGRSR